MEWDWGRIVFDHVTLTVRDAEASKAFYGTVLATLGIPPLWENERGAQYANLVVRTREGQEPGGPTHVAFVGASAKTLAPLSVAADTIFGVCISVKLRVLSTLRKPTIAPAPSRSIARRAGWRLVTTAWSSSVLIFAVILRLFNETGRISVTGVITVI